MEITDQQIRKAALERLNAAGPCIPAEELDSYFAGRLSEARTEEIRTHISACANCIETARDYLAFIEADRKPRRSLAEGSSASDGQGAALYKKPILQLAVAASVVFGVWLLWKTPSDSPPPPESSAVRGPSPEAVVELISPRGELVGRPGLLEWRPVPLATTYEAELRDSELKLLWKGANLRQTSVDIPVEVADALEPGREYGWRITAILSDGRRIVSPLQTFHRATKK